MDVFDAVVLKLADVGGGEQADSRTVEAEGGGELAEVPGRIHP
jgi:hypothetical protein